MTNGIELSQLVLPEQKDLAWEVAELVYSEVNRKEFRPSMFSKFIKEIRDDTVVVAQDSNGLLVATGAIVAAPSPMDAYITDVATVQSHRGMGIGRMVVSELERVAKSMGAERTIGMPLPASVAFYENLGYVNAGKGKTMMAKSLV